MAHVFVTGLPGCGKTTAILALHKILQQKGVKLAGFVTGELREAGQRVGFSITSLRTGESALLAHIKTSSAIRVGKYGVDLQALEKIALPELQEEAQVFLIDEVGKMECFSNHFVQGMKKLLDRSDVFVLGSVALKGGGFMAELRNRKDVQLVQVTINNRDHLPQQLAQQVMEFLKDHGAAKAG